MKRVTYRCKNITSVRINVSPVINVTLCVIFSSTTLFFLVNLITLYSDYYFLILAWIGCVSLKCHLWGTEGGEWEVCLQDGLSGQGGFWIGVSVAKEVGEWCLFREVGYYILVGCGDVQSLLIRDTMVGERGVCGQGRFGYRLPL